MEREMNPDGCPRQRQCEHGIFTAKGRLIRKTWPRLCEEPSLEFIRGISGMLEGSIEEVVYANEWRGKLV